MAIHCTVPIHFSRRRAGRIAAGGVLLALLGCGGESPPSVSSSTEEVTIHGSITYKGKAVSEGEIAFDPTNIQRKTAKVVSAKIGQDGSYTIKTLAGENAVSFRLPTLGRQDPALGYLTIQFVAASGDNIRDFDLSAPKP